MPADSINRRNKNNELIILPRGVIGGSEVLHWDEGITLSTNATIDELPESSNLKVQDKWLAMVTLQSQMTKYNSCQNFFNNTRPDLADQIVQQSEILLSQAQIMNDKKIKLAILRVCKILSKQDGFNDFLVDYNNRFNDGLLSVKVHKKSDIFFNITDDINELMISCDQEACLIKAKLNAHYYEAGMNLLVDEVIFNSEELQLTSFDSLPILDHQQIDETVAQYIRLLIDSGFTPSLDLTKKFINSFDDTLTQSISSIFSQNRVDVDLAVDYFLELNLFNTDGIMNELTNLANLTIRSCKDAPSLLAESLFNRRYDVMSLLEAAKLPGKMNNSSFMTGLIQDVEQSEFFEHYSSILLSSTLNDLIEFDNLESPVEHFDFESEHIITI